MYLYKSISCFFLSHYHHLKGFIMNAGDILQQVDGLTHDKLTYFVRAGYLNPKKIKRGSLNYNDFSDKDLFLTRCAWEYIQTYDMRTKAAFKRAEDEFNNPQISLWR